MATNGIRAASVARGNLTKSLHTVTAVARVAAYIEPIARERFPDGNHSARMVALHALGILGYSPSDYAADDPVILACIAATEKALRSARAPAPVRTMDDRSGLSRGCEFVTVRT